MKLFIVSAFMLILGGSSVRGQSSINQIEIRYDCSKYSPIQIDRMAHRMFTFGESGRSFPENPRELVPYCEETLAITNELSDYALNCPTSGFTRTFMQILFYTLQDKITKLCDQSSGMLSKRQLMLLDAAQCSNAVKPAHQQCIHMGMNYLMRTTRFRDISDKIAYICCNIPTMDTCMQEAMAENRSGKCSYKRAETAMDLISIMRKDSLAFMCAGYDPEESDMCNKYMEDSSRYSPSMKYKFYFMLLIEALSNAQH